MRYRDSRVKNSESTRRFTAIVVTICAALVAAIAIGGYAMAGEGGQQVQTAESEYFTGSGTESDPYMLEDADDLEQLATLVNSGTEGYVDAYYELANDIDMSSVSNFTPIGNSSSYFFEGTLDGGGYTVSNLTIDSTTAGSALIGYAKNVTVKNIIVSGSITSTKSYTAGIIGCATGTLDVYNCGNEATITSSGAYVGGIVAYNYCSSSAVTTIDSCYNTGTISASASSTSTGVYAGGIIGQLYYKANTTQNVTNCYNTGDITVTKGYGAGGIVGRLYNYNYSTSYMNVLNCYNTGTVSLSGASSTNSSKYGAIVGYFYSTSTTTYASNYVISNCYYLSTTTDQAHVTSSGVVSSCTAMTSDEMMASSFVDTLNGSDGTAWIAGTEYPILAWQTGTGTPSIVTDLSTSMVEYTVGDTEVVPLSISVSLPDSGNTGSDGTLSYQWYSVTYSEVTDEDGDTSTVATATAIDGATESSFTPPVTTTGCFYYYCVATNTWTDSGSTEASTASVTSSTACVYVHSGTPAATPTISMQPVSIDGIYQDAEAVLTVEASVSGDGAGELSYQWYSASDSDGTDAVAIDGATEATYTADTTALGTIYYFCVVTNTFEDTLTSSATSFSASVTVVVTEISTAAELKALADRVDAGDTCEGREFVLTADIDLQSDDSTKEWDPIGSSSISFQGTFDGQGHTVSGLYVDEYMYAGGLFGSLGAGATVENLIIEGSVAVTSWAGGLAGYVLGTGVTISNVGCDVDVEAYNQYAGGLVAAVSNTSYEVTIEGCYSHGSVTSASNYAGGLVGYFSAKTVVMTNCYSTSDVTGAGNSIGGLAGYASVSSSATFTATNCYAAGSVSSDGSYVGTFIGYSDSDIVLANCYVLEDDDLSAFGSDESTYPSGSITVVADDELKAASMVEVLGDAYAVDRTGINDGYPILSYESVEGAPQIVSSPSDVYTTRNAVETISVEAAVPEETPDGVLTYQWYRNGTGSVLVSESEEIEGATSSTYTVPTGADDVGINYYFCVVTNTFTSGGSTRTVSATSDAAAVTVVTAIDAAVPQVSSITGDVEYGYGAEADAIEVSVTIAELGAGDITYQWYVADSRTNDVSEATAIEGATDSSYVPSTDTAGTLYYFCVVTNTFEDVKVETAASLPVKVVVDAMTLADADDVVALSEAVAAGNTFDGVAIEVVADIDMSGVTDFTPIGTAVYPFAGQIEGNGYTISGLSVSSTSYGAGLFGYTDGAEISDLYVEGTVSSSGSYVGGIVGSASGTTLDGVRFTGTVTGDARVGGIVGYSEDSTISDATVSGTVTGDQYTGGVAGYITTTTTVSYALNNATVSASSTYCGGIVGYARGDVYIDHSANYGSVSSTAAYVGGVAGYFSGNVSSSYYPAGISESKNAGDVVTTTTATSGNVGGVAGYLYYGDADDGSYIIGCYNTGDVTGSDTANVGGLVGYLGTSSSKGISVTDCYSTGLVTAKSSSSYHGSLIGRVSTKSASYTTVSNDYAADDSDESYGDSVLYYSTYASDYFAEEVANQLLTVAQMRGEATVSADLDGDGTDETETYMLELLNSGELGSIYTSDYAGDEAVNDGFPLLVWETGYEADAETYPVTVTVDSGVTLVITDAQTGHNYVSYTDNGDGTRTYALPSGSYTWSASADGYFDGEGSFEVTEDGAELQISLLALPEFTLSIDVSTSDGTEFSGTVAVADSTGAAVELSEGYSATLVAGYYTYTVEMDGYVTQAGTVALLGDDVDLSIVLELYIVPVELDDDMVSVDSAVYTGEALVPTVTVTTDDGTVLVEGTDYTVSYTDAEGEEIDASQIVSAGTYYVVVTGDGYCYTGTATAEYVVLPSVVFAKVEAAGGEYSGEAVTPTVTVTAQDGTVLVEDEDYTVSYTDADGEEIDASQIVEPGTYYAVVTGTGSYGGQTEVAFTVTADIADATVTAADAVYAGEAVTADLTVVFGDTVLTEGEDYTVSYVDADGNAVESIEEYGTYTAIVTGTGVYAGTTSVSFTVYTSIALSDISVGSAVYADGAEVATGVVVTFEGTTLTAGEDYELSYSDNTEIGTAIVTVTGMGNFSGSVDVEFQVLAQYQAADLIDYVEQGAAAIAAVEISEDGSDVYVDATWATQDAVDSLQAAVDAAKAAATSGDQQAMQDAGTAIEAALEEFASVVQAGTLEYAEESTGARWTRLGGTNRYGTNALAVSAAYDSSDVVVLASGQVAADALAASGLAGMLDAPVVLTKAAELTEDALETIESLEATTVYVMGGTSAVSDDVVSALEALGVAVERVSGTNRVLTAIAIYETGAALGTWSTTAIVVNGFSTADALSASAYSSATESPIFMTNKDGSLSGETLAAIEAGGFSQVYVVGGEGVVSAEALEALSAIDGVSAERVAGANRYATSAAVVELCLSQGMSLTHAVIACGSDESFADALSGGSLAGSTNSVIMLVKEAGSGSNSMVCVDDVVAANATSVVSGYILGGTGVFTSDFYEYINSL